MLEEGWIGWGCVTDAVARFLSHPQRTSAQCQPRGGRSRG